MKVQHDISFLSPPEIWPFVSLDFKATEYFESKLLPPPPAFPFPWNRGTDYAQEQREMAETSEVFSCSAALAPALRCGQLAQGHVLGFGTPQGQGFLLLPSHPIPSHPIPSHPIGGRPPAWKYHSKYLVEICSLLRFLASRCAWCHTGPSLIPVLPRHWHGLVGTRAAAGAALLCSILQEVPTALPCAACPWVPCKNTGPGLEEIICMRRWLGSLLLLQLGI